jgi:tRNA(Ile)-lysidine synthase
VDISSLQKTLDLKCQLDKSLPLVIGVSGGADSLCLLDVLQQMGYCLVVAHLDHSLRPDSVTQARFVEQEARRRGLACRIAREDVHAYVQIHKLSVEEAARRVRYHFLFQTARQQCAQAVAVAHTADDQVETLLMNLLRGAGMAGLKGMLHRTILAEWDEKIPLVRPLLDNWREEVLAYCNQQGLTFQVDSSNEDPAFFRNRIRLHLIPELQRYNPQVKGALLRTAQTLKGDFSILQQAARQTFAHCLAQRGEGFLAFHIQDLRLAEDALLRLVFRHAVAQLRPTAREVGFDIIEQAVQFVRTPTRSGSVSLASFLKLELAGELLFLQEEQEEFPTAQFPGIPQNTPLLLPVPCKLELNSGWLLESEFVPPDQITPHFLTNPDHAWLDADSLSLPLMVRTRRRGDHFQPLGLEGKSMRLSDFLVNVKLPRQARDAYPLVCSGDEIIWVSGFRPAHPFCLSPHSRMAVHLWITPPPQNL